MKKQIKKRTIARMLTAIEKIKNGNLPIDEARRKVRRMDNWVYDSQKRLGYQQTYVEPERFTKAPEEIWVQDYYDEWRFSIPGRRLEPTTRKERDKFWRAGLMNKRTMDAILTC